MWHFLLNLSQASTFPSSGTSWCGCGFSVYCYKQFSLYFSSTHLCSITLKPCQFLAPWSNLAIIVYSVSNQNILFVLDLVRGIFIWCSPVLVLKDTEQSIPIHPRHTYFVNIHHITPSYPFSQLQCLSLIWQAFHALDDSCWLPLDILKIWSILWDVGTRSARWIQMMDKPWIYTVTE